MLSSLPPEILEMIFSYLGLDDVEAMIRVGFSRDLVTCLCGKSREFLDFGYLARFPRLKRVVGYFILYDPAPGKKEQNFPPPPGKQQSVSKDHRGTSQGNTSPPSGNEPQTNDQRYPSQSGKGKVYRSKPGEQGTTLKVEGKIYLKDFSLRNLARFQGWEVSLYTVNSHRCRCVHQSDDFIVLFNFWPYRKRVEQDYPHITTHNNVTVLGRKRLLHCSRMVKVKKGLRPLMGGDDVTSFPCLLHKFIRILEAHGALISRNPLRVSEESFPGSFRKELLLLNMRKALPGKDSYLHLEDLKYVLEHTLKRVDPFEEASLYSVPNLLRVEREINSLEVLSRSPTEQLFSSSGWTTGR